MGLDMYLTRQTYVKNWDHFEPEQRTTIAISGGRSKGVLPERITTVTEEVAYWRKANAIHAWFVNNVQNGTDDCREYYVDEDALRDLLQVVETVLKTPACAAELLPSQSGFFFGSTEYDEWYFQDLEYTRDAVRQILAEDCPWGTLYYQSSW